MKTIREWLNELDEPYRTHALANIKPRELQMKTKSIKDALSFAFVWADTEWKGQGRDYWKKVYNECLD